MGGSRAADACGMSKCLRFGHARYTQDSRSRREASRAGELSRGVGLRGFESHSPHHIENPPTIPSYTTIETWKDGP